jgi:hypothetical protein
VAGQIAKLKGARVIGVAGGPEKCAWLTEVAGFDAAIDYKNDDIAARLRDVAPDGIDIFYDNVGGAVLDAGLVNLAQGATVVLCGAISTRYSFADHPPPGVRNLAALVAKSARMEGFIVLNYAERFDEAAQQLGSWVRDGRIVVAEDLQQGTLEQAPATLRRLFDGGNIGKQLLQIAEPTGP